MGSEVHEFTLTPALAMCPTVTPRTPHLDTLRAKRLQFFSGTQSSHDVLYHAPSTSNPSEAPREGVSTPQAGLCDLPVSQSNGPVSQNDGPVSQSKGPVSLDLLQDEAGLDLLLLQDSAVPEHRKLRHVLAWAQNFIRTGPAIGPSEPWSREDHRTALKSDHVTSAKTAHVPPIYGDQVTQPKGNRVTRTTIEESTRQVLHHIPTLSPSPYPNPIHYHSHTLSLNPALFPSHTLILNPNPAPFPSLTLIRNPSSALSLSPASCPSRVSALGESRRAVQSHSSRESRRRAACDSGSTIPVVRLYLLGKALSRRRSRSTIQETLQPQIYLQTRHLCRTLAQVCRKSPGVLQREGGELLGLQDRNQKQAGGAVLIPWLSLPDELWMAILKLLPPGDLSCVAQTCHRLCGLANDRTLCKLRLLTWSSQPNYRTGLVADNCEDRVSMALCDDCTVTLTGEVVKIENSTCLNSDWLSSIGRRGPHSLTLYRCTDAHVTQWGLEQLFAQSKGSLRELRITHCSGPGLHGDRLLLPCSLHCPRLTDVDVSWTGATDAGISALASATTRQGRIQHHAMATSCPNLKVLNVGKLPRVRDRSVHLIARRCPELRSLTLRCCPNVTDRSLTEIGTYSATIRSLSRGAVGILLSTLIKTPPTTVTMAPSERQDRITTPKRRSDVTMATVRLLASHCSTHLHTLKLSFCYICQDSLRKLCQRCKGLRLLHLYGACDFHSSQELRDINQYLETKCDLTCA
ncbi:hypothetical protein JZ751_029682 [Albula glossodonta]|uniref:F-box domain-containing protein n=1 Tax=Albula glossodonta TaxID=121402 RepID=A0A8T2NHQ4_9TELE|nr:hypothetical protein JZ751_029682 [Albula glossodonta]